MPLQPQFEWRSVRIHFCAQFLLALSALLVLSAATFAQSTGDAPAPAATSEISRIFAGERKRRQPPAGQKTNAERRQLPIGDGNTKWTAIASAITALTSATGKKSPTALVDWDATKKVESEDAKRNAAIIAKVHALDVEHHASVMDIDASIEVAPKVFLPPGEGVFEYDGKSVRQLSQAEADIKFSKSQMLKQVLIPIPIVPSRHTVSLKGTHAKFRIKSGQIEFYMRTADGREPNLDLLRAKVHNDKRDLENLDQLFHEEAATGRIALPIQRWEIAQGVYRFTLAQDLEPGEYAIAEVVQGGETSLYFWDFGVDAGSGSPAKQAK